jgi:hypothetical protein
MTFMGDRNGNGNRVWAIAFGTVATREPSQKKSRPFGRVSTIARKNRDSDGTATAAINEDLSVPQDCQARAESIAQKDAPNA